MQNNTIHIIGFKVRQNIIAELQNPAENDTWFFGKNDDLFSDDKVF